MKTFKKYVTQYHISSPNRPNENPIEVSIRELKKRCYRIIYKKKFPEYLWDYGMVWISEIRNLSILISSYASGRRPLKFITRETFDISEYLDFTF